jgi:Flp pilus assembly protein TadD
MGIFPILDVIFLVVSFVIGFVFSFPINNFVFSVLIVLYFVIWGITPYYTFLGLRYINRGEYAKAEKYCQKAKIIGRKTFGKKNPSYAGTLINLGMVYGNMGDYAKAEKYCLEAEAIMEKGRGNKHRNYFLSLNNLGVVYRIMGNYAKAEKYCLEAEAIIEKRRGKKHPDYALSLYNMGVLYSNMGDHAKAEGYFLEAKAVREEALGKEHPSYADSLISLGSLYRDIGYYTKAEKYCLEAETIIEKRRGKKHPDYALSLNNLGALYRDKRKYEEAEKNLLEAKDIREKALGKEHPNYASTLNSLGVLYHDMGDYTNYTKAESYYLEAKTIFEKTLGKEHPDYASSLNNLGTLYSDMSDYAKAEKYYLNAKTIFEKALGKEHLSFITSLDNLFMLYLATKEYKQALSIRKEAYQLNTNLINRVFSSFSEKERETYWNRRSSSFDISYSLSHFHDVPESHALNYDNALFSKGLLLRTANAIRDSIYSSGDEGLIKQYKELISLRQQIGVLRQREGADERYIHKLERKADDLDKYLTQASVAYMVANKELKAYLALGWEKVRNSLDPGEAAIEFVSFNLYDKKWTGKIMYAALILRSGMEAPVWVNLCEETGLAEFFRKLDGKKPQEQARILYEEDGLTLYALVWQHLEKILEGAKTVYYSPSGLLHKLSFNAIPTKEGALLSSVYDLNLVSSTREIARRKSKAPEKPGSAALYGGLVYDIDTDETKQESQPDKNQETQIRSMPPEDIMRGCPFEYSEGSSEECLFIKHWFKEYEIPADLYTEESGNKESFMKLPEKKPKPGVIHMATHGFFWDDIEKNYEEMERLERLGGGKKALEDPLMRSGLALSGANNGWKNKALEGIENGILFAGDITNINLVGTELVVLSACETGLGVVNNMEGVFGLQRAFKLAGVETIVMSLWKVDDKATMKLMTWFYENWLSGRKSKQEAFKEAQGLLRETKGYSSPYYWAAFVMMD